MMIKCMILLLYPMLSDIKIKKFYIEPVLAGALFFASMALLTRQTTVGDILLGCLPGLLAGVMAWLTKGAIGMGDAAVIIGLGLIAGWKKTCGICMTAFFLCGMVGVFLILFKKADRRTELPFVPFLMAAVMILGVMRAGGLIG